MIVSITSSLLSKKFPLSDLTRVVSPKDCSQKIGSASLFYEPGQATKDADWNLSRQKVHENSTDRL